MLDSMSQLLLLHLNILCNSMTNIRRPFRYAIWAEVVDRLFRSLHMVSPINSSGFASLDSLGFFGKCIGILTFVQFNLGSHALPTEQSCIDRPPSAVHRLQAMSFFVCF